VGDNEEMLIVDAEDLVEKLWKDLPQCGFAPTEEEIDVIVDIVFEFLMDAGFIRIGEDEE
jgi:hypothetical protein